MKKDKIIIVMAMLAALLLILNSGCSKKSDNVQDANEPQEPVKTTAKLGLYLTQGDTAEYRLKTINQRKVFLESAEPGLAESFQGAQTISIFELTFDQMVTGVKDNGNIIAEITIKDLKYTAEVRDKSVLKYDSKIEAKKDPNLALPSLIGHGYTIELTPSGRVVRTVDANNVLSVISKVRSNLDATSGSNLDPNYVRAMDEQLNTAVKLMSDSSIEKNHSIPALPDVNKNEVDLGASWSDIVTFDFDDLGRKSYEKTYTFEKTEDSDGHKIAVINMNAIPSMVGIDVAEQEAAAVFNNMSDNRLNYTGQLKLDLNNHMLVKYQEELKSEWIIIPPGSGGSGPPNALNMTAVKSYDIEKID